jgi:hypothetical protein
MKILAIMALLAALPPIATPAPAGRSPFAGRWDLTITAKDTTYPGWMEVVEKAGKTEIRVQPRSGSVRVAENVRLEGSRLSLQVTPARDDRPEVTWDLRLDAGRLTGTQKRGSETAQVAGTRAPALKRAAPAAWGAPEPLFNGKDLTGWEPERPTASRWLVRDGILVNQDKGSNLRTTRKFDDFKLHIEFECPSAANSGIYLRGRYEIQVDCSAGSGNDPLHGMGAIYGFIAPSVQLPKRPGEWESFDVTLIGRWVTVLRNGVSTINNQEIPGITGGALDSHEGEPGPFYIQGDHGGGMKFRNITIAVPKR